ncbi:hypothetical protein IJU97_03210 [bacterium]|nr:hypothetical protein [bacterium]
MNVTLAAGDSTELRIQATNGYTVQVTSITIDAGSQKDLEISSDYTNVGKWTSFKVTASGNKSDNTPVVTF